MRKPLTLKNNLISSQTKLSQFPKNFINHRKAQPKKKTFGPPDSTNFVRKNNSIIIIFGHPTKLRNQDMKTKIAGKLEKSQLKMKN
jgi:hypothetical protein